MRDEPADVADLIDGLRVSRPPLVNQANSTSGLLHSDHYHVPRRETGLGRPFDSDFESEEYYDHAN